VGRLAAVSPILDGLDVAAIRRQLAGEVVGTHVYLFGDVVSTNAALRELAAAGAREGTVVLAESQRAARGRLDTTWFSPPGVNLYASVLFRPIIVAAASPIFSFIASLALTEAIWALGVPAGVKWPNDIVVRGRKLAGARLDVSTVGDRVAHIVVGVGVNVNVLRAELEVGLGPAAADATSLREELGRPVDRNAFAASYLNQLEKWHRLYEANGPETVVMVWRERDVLTGRRVSIQGVDAPFVGTVCGVDAGGFLVVEDAAGNRRTIVSAAVRPLDERAR
jgi:BirA family biotin operon repressor/biotin-[acetyl-CoA-carboxylase] ligase